VALNKRNHKEGKKAGLSILVFNNINKYSPYRIILQSKKNIIFHKNGNRNQEPGIVTPLELVL
jgi:hypothetical protein